MSNPLTDLRTALVKLLADAFPDTTVVGGELDEPVSRDRDEICVFWETTPTAGNVNYAQPRVRIRYWKKLPKISSLLADVPADDGPLEQAWYDLSTVLMPARATAVPGKLYFEVALVAPVRDEHAIEATLLVNLQNPGAVPA